MKRETTTVSAEEFFLSPVLAERIFFRLADAARSSDEIQLRFLRRANAERLGRS